MPKEVLTKETLLRAVAEAILANDAMTPDGWIRSVVMASIDDESTGITGLVYSTGGTYRSVVPKSPSPMKLFDQLRTRMAQDDTSQRPWLAALVQLDNHGEDVDMDFQFEYDNADRWAITPDTLMKIVNQFRPSHSQ